MGFLSSVADFGSDIISGAGDFLSSGGGEAVSNAGEAMAQSQIGGSGGGVVGFAGDMFGAASNFAGDAFNWIGDNPEAANLLGGVATGVGQYYNAEQQREQNVRENRKDRQLQRDLANQRIDAQKIAPGSMGDNYGSYTDGISSGLISNGMLASGRASNA